MQQKIIFGKKRRTIMTPDGYCVITDKSEVITHGDKWLNIYSEKWHDVEPDDEGISIEEFGCVIRRKYYWPTELEPCVIMPNWNKTPETA